MPLVLVDSQCQTEDLFPLLHADGSHPSSFHRNSSNNCLLQAANDSASTCAIVGGISQMRRLNFSTKSAWMSTRVKRCLYLLLILSLFGTLGIMYFGVYCPDAVCAFSMSTTKLRNDLRHSIPPLDSMLLQLDQPGKPLSESYRSDSNPSYADVISKDFQFDISGHDVMVFLHIQKTGGTSFGRHLVRDLDLKRGCQCHSKIRKRCTCLRPGPHSSETWLFSRYSTGWQCGLHADWTELTACVDTAMADMEDSHVRRKYFYITFLRDPVQRFLSEYRHVQRGATWKNARLFCGGRRATKDEVGLCYEGEVWENPTLEHFMDCPHNLAVNRQTRMLADLVLVGCYNQSVLGPTKRNELMLSSAKQNLNRMAFFGLTEEQEKSQYLFEETFNLRFSVRFGQYNKTIADSSVANISSQLLDKIRKLNHLDVQLYEYTQQLLQQRFYRLSSQDRHFTEHFSNMGKSNFSWDALEGGA